MNNYHIILNNRDSNTLKFITTLRELGQVFWNCLSFLHFDFSKFILQCQFPLVTAILIQVHWCFPHSIWSFLSVETWENVVSNTLKNYPPCLRHTLIPFGQIMCIRCCWLRNFWSMNYFKPLSSSTTSIISLHVIKFKLSSKAYLSCKA